MDRKRELKLKLSKELLEKRKNSVFGESFVSKFVLGEIVRWPHTEQNVVRIYKYGVLMSIYTGKLDKREIKIAEILPFGCINPVKISLILVKKSDLED